MFAVDSELLAEMAASEHSTYIKKDNYLDDCADDELCGLGDNIYLEDEYDFLSEEIECVDVTPSTYQSSELFFSITEQKLDRVCWIWDLYLNIEYTDLSENMVEYLLDHDFELSIMMRCPGLHGDPRFGIITIPLKINLFFANLANKKIYIEDGMIKIPIIIDYFMGGKFPIHRCDKEYYDRSKADFTFYSNYGAHIPDANISLTYKLTKDKRIEQGISETLSTLNTCPIRRYIGHTKKLDLLLRGIVKFIIFEFSAYQNEQLVEPVYVNKVKLYLNGQKPIVYKNSLGEIIYFSIYGKNIYGIPLSPQFKTLGLTKHFLQNKSRSKKMFDYGINMDRIDNAQIQFDIDSNINCIVDIYSIYTEIFQTCKLY